MRDYLVQHVVDDTRKSVATGSFAACDKATADLGRVNENLGWI